MNYKLKKGSLNSQLSDPFKEATVMGWYVLQCKAGQEEKIIKSCKQHISSHVLKEAFIFRCMRLWRTGGVWKLVGREMFPGYIFLESSYPELLLEELCQYRSIFRVIKEPGYLISVYRDEEKNLRRLCGESHILELSYGFKDQETGKIKIIRGPLTEKGFEIKKIDFHKRFAQVEIPVDRKKFLIWAGVEVAPEIFVG